MRIFVQTMFTAGVSGVAWVVSYVEVPATVIKIQSSNQSPFGQLIKVTSRL